MENFARQRVMFAFTRAQARTCMLVMLGDAPLSGEGAGGQRELNKYTLLEVKDSVLVPSLCQVPDATYNTESGLSKRLPGSLEHSLCKAGKR